MSASFLGDGILQVGAVAANNYASWAATQSPPVTGGATGDDDNHGVANLVEYALAYSGERETRRNSICHRSHEAKPGFYPRI